MQELKIGALLRHQTYRIEKILGQGGFGITYLATDISLERLVAIKEFFPKDYCERISDTSQITLGTSSTAEFVSRLKAKFIKEARNIAKLDHPGIIRIHAAFEENNTAYYVMDYIDGESLSDKVKKHGPLSLDQALKYLNGISNALEYIHGKKINHLDLKPANVMIRESDDLPILIDFGLSKQYDAEGNQTSTTPTGISHGFAPLEQYNAGGVKEFSPQTDIYSLAATFYYLLTGIVPPNATELIENSIYFPSDFPQGLKSAISIGMASARKDRFSSVALFLAAVNGDEDGAENTVIEGDKYEGAQANDILVVSADNNSKEQRLKSQSDKSKSAKLGTWIVWIICIVLPILAIMGAIFSPSVGNSSDIEEAVDSIEVVAEEVVEEVADSVVADSVVADSAAVEAPVAE